MGKLGKTLVSVGSILIVAVVGILIYCYWPAITGTVNNNKYYTQEDVQKAYDDGYADGNKSESELTTKYEYYKSLVDDYYVQVTTLNEEINKLSNENASYSTQVKNLTTQKTNLQAQVDNLTSIKQTNESTIADLNNQITNLQSQVKNLTNSSEDKSEQIANLNTQITNLQNTVSQLQTTNKMNLDTITSLNNQISSLNAQISEMTENSQNYTSKINALNSKISELQKSIAYYEAYIAQLENTEQVVATFEFDGSVYNIQIVNKGSKLSVVTPTSTEYKIFNGWTVNGQAIDLNTFTITTNTKIVADITYKFDVKFKVDDEFVSNQVIVKDNFATLPSNPTKDGYEFDGWSLNGVNVISDIATKPVTENTTYIAVFTKLHTVTFVYENDTKSTQTIRNGELAKNVPITNTDYKVFNGWKVNGIIVDLTTYKIVSNTTFVADITYKFDVKFMVDNTIYNSQIIVKNNYATLPTNPTKDGYEFDGWSLNGVDVISDITTTLVTENTTYTAIFTKLHNVTFIVNGKILEIKQVRNGEYVSDISNECIWTLNGNIVNFNEYPIFSDVTFVGNTEYTKLDKVTWEGLSNFKASYVWSDGENYYYSEGEKQYVLNKSTKTWSVKIWDGFSNIYGNQFWTLGDNLYYSRGKDQYVFDKVTKNFTKKDWGTTGLYGMDIWTDGENAYYSYLSTDGRLTDSAILLKGSNSWISARTYDGYYVWADDENIYYSYKEEQYIFDKETQTWSAYTWNGLSSFSGSNIWTDGENYYYSEGEKQYVLDKTTKTWTVKTWEGLNTFKGYYTWTDGENYYYSYGEEQYIFVRSYGN